MSSSFGYPRRPKSAFFCYNDAVRARLREQYPSFKQSDIVKKMGEQWEALTEEERLPYHDAANQDLERYRKEVILLRRTDRKQRQQTVVHDASDDDEDSNEEDEENNDEEKDKENDKDEKHKTVAPPKEAIFWFMDAMRQQVPVSPHNLCPTAKQSDMIKKLLAQWNNLSDKDMQPYVVLASNDLKRYQLETRK